LSGTKAVVWQYRKIALNEAPRRVLDVDLLCEAGEEGWELVTILSNNVAYLKRFEGQSEGPTSEAAPQVRYRDPQTNETWSGRGRMPNWLKRKQDAGEDIERYRC
jgi:H-NS histone family